MKLLPPANEVLGQGNVFTPVCHPVHRERGSALDADSPGVGQTPWMQTPWMQIPPGWADPPRLGKPPVDADPPTVGQTPWGWAGLPWMQTPRVWADPRRYGQQAGGTHPTGMHTCSKIG